MLGVRILRATAWTLLVFGSMWWLLLALLASVFGASGAGWLFLGGIGALSLPVGVVWLLRDNTVERVVGAGAITIGMGVALALWSDLDDLVSGSQELGWIVIAIGVAGTIIALSNRTAPARESPSGRSVRRR